MEIRVKLFAILRERAKTTELTFDIPVGLSIVKLLRKIRESHPFLLDDGIPIMVAANAEYVDDSYVIQDGDDIALIPPVSGGGRMNSRSLH